METKTPKKSIDDIKKMQEMIEICKLLQICFDEENCNLKEMREKAKEHIQQYNSSEISVCTLVLNGYFLTWLQGLDTTKVVGVHIYIFVFTDLKKRYLKKTRNQIIFEGQILN